jgi:hypothetical protein
VTIVEISESIKQEIAEKVCEQASPGYSTGAQGEWYVVDGEKVVHAQENRPWNPWHDDAEVVSVDELVFILGGADEDRASFDPSPEGDVSEEVAWEAAVMFALGYVPDRYDTADLPYEDA